MAEAEQDMTISTNSNQITLIRFWNLKSPISLRLVTRIHMDVTAIMLVFFLLLMLVGPGGMIQGPWTLPTHSLIVVVFLNGLADYIELFSVLVITLWIASLLVLRGSEGNARIHICALLATMCFVLTPSYGSS